MKISDIALLLTCLVFLTIGALFLGPYFLVEGKHSETSCENQINHNPIDNPDHDQAYQAIAQLLAQQKLAFLHTHHQETVKFTELPDHRQQIQAQLSTSANLDISANQLSLKLPSRHTNVTYPWLNSRSKNQPVSVQYTVVSHCKNMRGQRIVLQTVSIRQPD